MGEPGDRATGEGCLEGIRDVLLGSRSLLLTTHIYPDGDSIGSEIALARGIRSLGGDRTVHILNPHPAPENYAFLDPAGEIRVVPAEGEPLDVPPVDTVVVLDASEMARLGRLAEWLRASPSTKVCIDHHLASSRAGYDHHFARAGSPATGCLVLEVLEVIGAEIDGPMADALFVAIATDTGWFRFSNTTEEVFRAVARLVRAGARPGDLYAQLYERYSLKRMALLGEMLAAAVTRFGGRFVYSVVSRGMMGRSGLGHEEVDGFVEEMKAIRDAEVIALVVELPGDAVKVSLRAKGAVDVNAIAVSFGGGGHAKASGYRLKGRTDRIVRELTDAVGRLLAGRPSG